MLKHGILGLLNYGSMTGYELMEAFRDSLSYFWSANTSQIYRELQGLKASGFAEDVTIPQSGKPDKKLFSITPAGRGELRRWLLSEQWDNRIKFPILMRMFFAAECSNEEVCTLLNGVLLQCRQHAEELKQAADHSHKYRRQVQDEQVIRYWDMTMDFKKRYNQMMQEWCQSCLQRIMQKEE